jgi:hypothetical protein
VTTYHGWWQVPAHLLSATALGELEYPRAPDGEPAAWVEVGENWQGKRDTIALYDARACPPTTATAGQLAAAATRSGRRRVCADCDARCQRPLPPLSEQDPRPLCPACRHIAQLRQRHAQLAQARLACAQRAGQLLGWSDAAIVQVDLTVPPPTPAGRPRPPTAAHVRAVDPAGTRLVDVLVRLVGPRARHVPHGATPQEEAVPTVHRAVLGRRLLLWSVTDLWHLHAAAPHQTLPGAWQVSELPQPHLQVPDHVRAVAVGQLATTWRGQLDPRTRALVECLAPGAPDRLLLLLRRIATTTAPAAQQPAAVEGGGGVAAPTPTVGPPATGEGR